MADSKLNGHVAIPRWFIWFVTFSAGLTMTGGIPWAWRVQVDVAQIRANGEATKEVVSVEMREFRRRLDRIEARLDRMELER